MAPPPGWQNPITAQAGQMQYGVDPLRLLPFRQDLIKRSLEDQRALLLSNTPRYTPIEVTSSGVIWDGHHAVRAAAEEGRTVDVLVLDEELPPSAASILDLPVR
jgi:hypothetical protein